MNFGCYLYMLLRYIPFIFSFFICFGLIGQEKLFDKALSSFLSNESIKTAHVGVVLSNPTGDTTFINHQENKFFIPASITKLWTTAMSTQLLSSEYVFTTHIGFNGELDTLSKVLEGDLLVLTNGDPSLQSRYFESKSFLEELKSAISKLQLKKIEGSLIILPTKDDYHVCSHWLWSDLGNYYGAGYASSTFMDNMVELYFKTDKSPNKTTQILKTHPKSSSFLMENNVISGIKNRDMSYAFGAPLQKNRYINGKLPTNRDSYKVKVSMHSPKAFLNEAILDLLNELNIEVQNNKVMSLSKASMDTIFSYTSPKLSELVKCVNYESNNNYAEHLLVESAKENGVSPSIDSAAKFMEAYWSTLFKNQVFFSDGSGLSRKNLITPNAMSGLLIEIINQFDLNDKNVMLNSLPSAGESGTLKYIGGNTVLEGNFIGKSGSMGGVRCYTGYFKKNNDYYPFTVMVNNFLVPDRAIRKAIESLMIDIYSAL